MMATERTPRGPSHFRQRDIKAAVRALEAAGKEVYRVALGKDGSIIFIISRDDPAAQVPADLVEEIRGWQP